jgi:hypothetical protein
LPLEPLEDEDDGMGLEDNSDGKSDDDEVLNWVSPFSSLHVYHVICGDSFMLKL